jgi:hypothetical protein
MQAYILLPVILSMLLFYEFLYDVYITERHE